jgi:glycosyltransferase involved in cell wall biosynthesis
MKIAMLLSCETFEHFFPPILGFDYDRFLSSYRHDWSWYYGKGLLENGVETVLYIPSVKYSGIHRTDAGIRVRFVRCEEWYNLVSPFTRACRISRWTVYLQQRLNAAAFTANLNAVMAEDEIDLLYVQEYWTGRFDHLVHRCPWPVTAADHGGVAQGVLKLFKRSAFKSAAALYCQTTDECNTVKSFGGSGMFCPNGTDTKFFCPAPAGTAKSKTILTVARLTDKQKRTSDLIRSMPHLSSDWTLNIVGTGPDRKMLEGLVSQLGVTDRVNFLGFKSRAEVRVLLQTCGVYAMPSSNEAVCLAVLEAMSCGAAVVATRIRSFESLIEDDVSGYLVPVADPPALAKAIEKAWAVRDRLGLRAATTIEEDFDSKELFRRLAQSLRAAARLSTDETTPGREVDGPDLIEACE